MISNKRYFAIATLVLGSILLGIISQSFLHWFRNVILFNYFIRVLSVYFTESDPIDGSDIRQAEQRYTTIQLLIIDAVVECIKLNVSIYYNITYVPYKLTVMPYSTPSLDYKRIIQDYLNKGSMFPMGYIYIIWHLFGYFSIMMLGDAVLKLNFLALLMKLIVILILGIIGISLYFKLNYMILSILPKQEEERDSERNERSRTLRFLEYGSIAFNFITIQFKSFYRHCYHQLFGHGRCIECGLPFSDGNLWCNSCYSKRFQKNFSLWDSGNETINDIIRNTQRNARNPSQVILWIPYEDFTDIEYIASGGFSKVYRANWMINKEIRISDRVFRISMNVALKELNDSSNISDDFLEELKLNIKFNNNPYTLKILGISRNPTTNNYIIVTRYMKNGSLSEILNKKKLNWREKLRLILNILDGLRLIHDTGYLHCDIHCGNIFYENDFEIYISDFGISIPASAASESAKHNNPRGVLRCVAPEVLKGGSCTRESDVYSFGILCWELITQRKAYADIMEDYFGLRSRICLGLRPEFNENTPKYLKELITSCWDADPEKRPKIYKLMVVIGAMLFYIDNAKENVMDESQVEENQSSDQLQDCTNSNDSYDQELERKLNSSNAEEFMNTSLSCEIGADQWRNLLNQS